MRQLLTFEDVLLEPGYSDIASRADIDISQEFLGMKFKLPIISANMSNVTEHDMAVAMGQNGGLGVIHRFLPEEKMLGAVAQAHGRKQHVAFSVGVRDPQAEMITIDYIMNEMEITDITVVVDTAQGHHQRVADMVKRLKDFGVPRVIAGNVATVEGYSFLNAAGADAVKVGIGPGAACTTRAVTGVGVPQLSAIMDIQQYWRYSDHRVPIIADGGMKSSGDIVKALAAGADMVMLGSLLSGTDEAPGETRVDLSGQVWKEYNGNSIFGSNADQYIPEGVEGWVKVKGPVKKVLEGLDAGIRSGMSYVGARNLTELREKANFIQITQAGYQIESAVRVTVD